MSASSPPSQPIDVDDFSPEEDTALLGLLREIVQADGEYSLEEVEEVEGVRQALGADRFENAIEEASAFSSRAELKNFLRDISRPKAQQVIFDILTQVAASDGVSPEEEKPLRWLASWWDIEA